MVERGIGRGVGRNVGRGRGFKHIQLFNEDVKMFLKFKLIFLLINIKTEKRKSRCYLKILTVKNNNIV